MNLKITYKTFAVVGLLIMALAAVFYFSGVRVNTTKSIPLGFYKTTDVKAKKGDYVLFCPTDAEVFIEAKKRGYISTGLCDGSTGLMMKKILAAKDDVVSSGVNGVFVNGKKLTNSTPKVKDGNGNLMQIFIAEKVVLDDSQVLLMSDSSANSFDARYFGLVNKSQIKSKIEPVFNW